MLWSCAAGSACVLPGGRYLYSPSHPHLVGKLRFGIFQGRTFICPAAAWCWKLDLTRYEPPTSLVDPRRLHSWGLKNSPTSFFLDDNNDHQVCLCPIIEHYTRPSVVNGAPLGMLQVLPPGGCTADWFCLSVKEKWSRIIDLHPLAHLERTRVQARFWFFASRLTVMVSVMLLRCLTVDVSWPLGCNI